MVNFVHDLFSNLVLLAGVVVVCRLCARFAPTGTLDGYAVFIAVIVCALLLDAALTFLVFADSRIRYGMFADASDFFQRAAAYGVSAVIAWTIRATRRRVRATPRQQSRAVTIHTSPHTRSELPM